MRRKEKMEAHGTKKYVSPHSGESRRPYSTTYSGLKVGT